MKAYDIAKEITNSGNYTLLAEILDELSFNWEGTYLLVKEELKDSIKWHEDE